MPGSGITAGHRRRAGDRGQPRCRRAHSACFLALLLALLLGWLGQAWSLHLHLPETPERHHTARIPAEGAGEAHSCGTTGQAGDDRHEGLAEHFDCLLCRSARGWRDGPAATTPNLDDRATSGPGLRLARPGREAPSGAPLLAANASRAPPRLSRQHV
ncbi:MAG: hypothetical protein JRG96_16885 [Deltaproteobacteria bacterium]|nr:hypothetical protein [Deltaproteobacteria bacterium]MBW2420481.1 hypothetical protein [Deltaproteobacteria bacterium]